MADLVHDDQDEVMRSTSETPPTHYTVEILQFSLLTKNNVESYESSDFEAGGYKWKLVIHPNGNKNKNVKEHISVYLAMAKASSLPPGWEAYAVFRLFLLDQNKDNYLTLEGTTLEGRRFHKMKLEWGFDQFIPLKAFNHASNGYLADDKCVFGAEVFVRKEKTKGKAECLSMIKDPITYKHTWKIVNLWELNRMCNDSEKFTAGDQKWTIRLYPTGKGNTIISTDSHLSLYVALADPESLPHGSKIFVEFTLRILDQMNSKHHSGKDHYWFSASNLESGWTRFISLGNLYKPTAGLIVKGSVSVEAEVNILGVANAL